MCSVYSATSCYTAAALASDRVLVTVTGPDRTGVTATLTGILSQQGATLHDIEQVVVQGQLTLCLLIGVPETRDVLKELLFAAKQLEMELDFKPVPAHRGGRDHGPCPRTPRLQDRGHQRRLLARRRGLEAPPRARLRLFEQPGDRGRQADRPGGRADRQCAAQGGAPRDHRPGRGGA